MAQQCDRMKTWSYLYYSAPLSKISGIFKGFRETVESKYELRYVSVCLHGTIGLPLNGFS